jgi:hypothetical protein
MCSCETKTEVFGIVVFDPSAGRTLRSKLCLIGRQIRLALRGHTGDGDCCELTVQPKGHNKASPNMELQYILRYWTVFVRGRTVLAQIRKHMEATQ